MSHTTSKRDKFWFDRDDELYPLFIEELKGAVEKGYSVIELSRTLNLGTRNLYALLRSEQVFPPIKLGRPKPFALPERFAKSLQNCKLGFLQWCNSHGLDPAATAQALASPEDTADPASVAAHRAGRQDFRQAYGKVFSEVQEISVSSRPTSDYLHTHYTLSIDHDPERGKFVAYIHELPQCRVEARSRDHAFRLIKCRYVTFASIIKLRMLPPRDEICQ
jgi:hypothetical protein